MDKTLMLIDEKEKKAAYSRKYYHSPREEVRARAKAHRLSHIEHHKEVDRRYREAHRGEQKEADHRYYLLHKEERLLRQAVQASAVRNFVMNVKAQVGCFRCSESEPVCLDFHHVEGGRERLMSQIRSWPRVMVELAKCEILCSNCHRKEHYL